MIRGTNLTVRRGIKVLLDGAEFVIHPGERVGIVGKNGAGKTTLFGLLLGQLDADGGDLDMPAGWRIASVEQELHADDRPAREFVIDGDTTLRGLQAERAAIDDAHSGSSDTVGGDLGNRIAELEIALGEAGAWDANARAEQLLAGLGFTPEQWMRPVESFSGGWRMRLALARALMAPSELLLLDEPTNHLDLDAMLWLEKWLASYDGTVLLISHDTEFLNAVARTILHFDQAKLIRYRGGYDDFLTQRAERLRQTSIAIDRQARETARLQGFIDRFKAKASKAKQAQSRVKALARMQTLAPLHAEAGIHIAIPKPESMPDPLLTLDGARVGYRDEQGQQNTILQNVTLMVRSASRIGILGANGAGKSTLIKALCGDLTLQAGERRPAKGLAIGYFAQHQLDMLDLDASPLAHLMRIAPGTREQILRNYLGGFGFSGNTVLDRVEPMSGGEKARLALSLIVWQKPNLLLLDEPSNHLDVDTREALAAALAEFGGSMLMVSHDRHLLRTTVDSFWIVADGQVHEFDGDLEDYREWLAQRTSQANSTARAQAAKVLSADRVAGAVSGAASPRPTDATSRGTVQSSTRRSGATEISTAPGQVSDGATSSEMNYSGSDSSNAAAAPLNGVERKRQRQEEAERRQQLGTLRKPLDARIKKIETEMERAKARLLELDDLLADAALYEDARREERIAALAEHGSLNATMQELESEWLTLQEKLETLTAS